MMPRLALAVLLLGLTVWAIRWAASAPPARVARLLKFLGLTALAGFGLWLMLSGQLAGLLAVAASLTPWLVRALRLHALWRLFRQTRTNRPPPAARTAMSREEAWEVLGLEPGASPEAIKEAHRRLMRQSHPDHGGSTWIAARLNQARDLLLGD